MIQDAEANAADDKRFEELATARNQADGLAHSTRKTLEEAGDKATEEEKAAITKAIEEVEAAVKGDDKDEIEAKTKALSEAAAGLAQKMYADAQQQGDASTAEAKADSAADDAVDAEFEEVKDDKK